jgi:hypothetical protein
MRFLLLMPFLFLTACAVSPQLDQNELARIRASVPASDGAIRRATIAIWLPGSSDFRFKAIEPRVQGIAVITDKSFLFQQWGGPNSLNSAVAIPFSSIKTAALNEFGRSGRIVIRRMDGSVDSFAASDGNGEISIGSETAKIFEVLASGLDPAQISSPSR